MIDWKNITSEQFDSLFDAVLKYLQDPSSGTTKHYNWKKTLKKLLMVLILDDWGFNIENKIYENK